MILLECFVYGTPIAQPRDTPSFILPSMRDLSAAPNAGRPLWHWLRKKVRAGTRGVPSEHKIHAWKKIVLTDVRIAMREQGATTAESAILVDLTFVMPRPKSKTKKKGRNPRYWYAQKPDIDNLTKGVLDALNEFAWVDDALIVGGTTLCFAASPGDQSGVAIRVTRAPDQIKSWADPMIDQLGKQESFF